MGVRVPRAAIARAFWAVPLLVAATLVALLVDHSGPAPKPVWAEEFAGPAGAAPDPARWSVQTGGYGWGNQELECYTDARENSALDGRGHLVITARAAPGHRCADGHRNDFTSARLYARPAQAMRYGRIVVRAELPTGPGVWPAIWALGANMPAVGWPRCGEMDIAEVAGIRPREVHASLHGPAPGGGPYTVTRVARLSRPVDRQFHRYAVSWTDHSVRFSIDDRTVLRTDRRTVERQGSWVFAQPFRLVLDVAVGGVYGGPPTAATPWPRAMVVDYVRVYR